MAKRGRKTKDQELLGRVRKPAPGDRWECPGHLSGVAREAWARCVAMLEETGNLERTDPALIESYAINCEALRIAHADLEAHGSLLEGSHGGMVANPALTTINQASRSIKLILAELGLTPATAKLSNASTQQPSSKWGDLIGVVG